MTYSFTHQRGSANAAVNALSDCLGLLSKVAWGLAPIGARFALAIPFLKSGLTRWDGWFQLSDVTMFMFQEQFKLHIFGSEFAMPFPEITAPMVATAEIVLPFLLFLGLGTRLSALALLIMTGVIQLVFPDGWSNFHLPWAALALSILALGPGPVSLDWLVKKFTFG